MLWICPKPSCQDRKQIGCLLHLLLSISSLTSSCLVSIAILTHPKCKYRLFIMLSYFCMKALWHKSITDVIPSNKSQFVQFSEAITAILQPCGTWLGATCFPTTRNSPEILLDLLLDSLSWSSTSLSMWSSVLHSFSLWFSHQPGINWAFTKHIKLRGEECNIMVDSDTQTQKL